MDFAGIVWGSALAALFTAIVFVVMPIRFKFAGHDKLLGVIPFAILIFIGNMLANPLVQKGCDLQKGYTIGLMSAMIYLAGCVTLDLIKQFVQYISRRIPHEEWCNCQREDARRIRDIIQDLHR